MADKKDTKDNTSEEEQQVVKKRAKSARYFAFILTVGKVEYIKGKRDAANFEDENAAIIVDKVEFYTKAEFDKYKNTTHVTTPTKTKGNKDPKENIPPVLSKEEKARMEAVLQRIQDNRSGDCLEMHWKTSSKSKITIVCFRFKNSEKKDDWRIKTNHFCVALRSAIVDFPCANPIVNEALLSLDYGLMRDTSQSPKTPVSNDWTSPKKKVYTYYDYVMYGYFPIPVEAIASIEEETYYIENMCREIGKAVLNIMQEEYFKPCYQAAINRENIWANIADESNVNKQYWNWAKNAQVKPIKCENLNRHLVLEESTLLVGKLYENNQATTKYSPLKMSNEDSSESAAESGSDSDSPSKDEKDKQSDHETEDKGTSHTATRKRTDAKHHETEKASDESKTPARGGKRSRREAKNNA